MLHLRFECYILYTDKFRPNLDGDEVVRALVSDRLRGERLAASGRSVQQDAPGRGQAHAPVLGGLGQRDFHHRPHLVLEVFVPRDVRVLHLSVVRLLDFIFAGFSSTMFRSSALK